MDILVGKLIAAGEAYADPREVDAVRPNRALNCTRGLRTIPERPVVRDETVAIVGFGPSLADTWRTVALAPTVWTTSKAHDYLLERGVEPSYHTDVDYRAHKANFIARFRPETQYWVASHVHPSFIDKAVEHGADLRIFHSLVPGASPYEPGYRKVAAMLDAGLQAAYLAYHAGYRTQHWYGIDGSMTDQTHAGPHEGILGTAEPFGVLVQGLVYKSNGLLLRAALWAEKMLREHPKLEVTIHGNGMLRPFLQERGRVRVN